MPEIRHQACEDHRLRMGRYWQLLVKTIDPRIERVALRKLTILLFVVVITWFWLRYRRLNKRMPN